MPKPTDPPSFPEPPDPTDPPPAPTFPDPWPPHFAIHLYGLNWDFESWEQTEPGRWADVRGAVEQAVVLILRSQEVSAEFAFSVDYASPEGVVSVLSIGAWQSRTEKAGRDARKRGLRAARTPGQHKQTGEVQVAGAVVANLIRAAIPQRVKADVPNRLISSSVLATAPAGFTIAIVYELNTLVGPIDVQATTAVGFAATNGELVVSVAPIQLSAAGLAPLFFDPVTWLGVAFGALVLVYTVIQNVGSGRPPLSNLGLEGVPSLGPPPRDYLIGPLHVHLNFLPPSFVGIVSEAGVLRLPFGFTFAVRKPAASIQGPVAVALLTGEGDSPTAGLALDAVATDFDRPAFAWTIDGQPAGAGPTPVLELSATGLRIGDHRTFRIGVLATDHVDATITANAELIVTGTARRRPPKTEPRDPAA